MRTETNLILFNNLTDKQINGSTIRSLFALVRSTLVAKTGDPITAIHTRHRVPRTEMERRHAGDCGQAADRFLPR